MGTDIHMVVETRVNGVWVSHTKFEEKYDDGYKWPVEYAYSGRNYDLFAILADVRNGHGFAGCDTGDGFVPIAEPKGFPTDMSPEVADWAEHVEHTPTWLTVAEIMAYDWTQTTRKRGVTGSLAQIARFVKNGQPEEWSGDISGDGIRKFRFDEAMRLRFEELFSTLPEDSRGRKLDWWNLYRAGDADDWNPSPERDERIEQFRQKLRHELGCEQPFFSLEWQVKYYDQAGSFLSATLPQLWRLGAPEDVRVVFYFDS